MSDKYKKGLDVVKDHLSPQQIKVIEEISPYLKDLVIEYGMGEVYARKGLDPKSRKIATIAPLSLREIPLKSNGTLQEDFLLVSSRKKRWKK